MKIQELFEASTARLHLSEMPTTPIERYSVQFNFKEPTTLKDIHKLVKCKRLIINGCGMVTGNVLGIFKMNLLDVGFIGIPNDHSRVWVRIVTEHFQNDKNIIACQEELFQNGLDEYAKL